MKLKFLVFLGILSYLYSAQLIIPKDSDIRYCIDSASNASKELMYAKPQPELLEKWFKLAFSDQLTSSTKNYLLKSSILADVKDSINNLKIISDDSNCKDFIINLEYSFTKAKERLSSFKDLGISIDKKSKSYIVSDSTTNVYGSILGKKQVIATLKRGDTLVLIEEAKNTSGIKYGKFVFKDKKNKKIGWIIMSDVTQDD